MALERIQEDPKNCLHCGKALKRKRFGDRLEDMTAFTRRKFCSLACANSRKHPKHWGTYHLRAKKFKKDACEACDYRKALQVHHVDQNPENNDPTNLQTLCKHCHDFWHTTARRLGKTVAGRMPSLV